MDKISICIDPGHGGADRENRGISGYYVEADGMLDISLKLRDKLITNGNFKVLLTRDKDKTVGVRERGEMAASWGADMFLSLHSNASGKQENTSVRGVNVFYSVDIQDDKELAQSFSKTIAEAMGTKDRGALTRESNNYPGEDYYGVIDSSQDGGVKHVFLIENGFHDNLEDEKLLRDPNIRTKIADAIFTVICNFYGVEKLNWKQKIVKEALDTGLITSDEWIEKADEKATVWFVCAVAINCQKLKIPPNK